MPSIVGWALFVVGTILLFLGLFLGLIARHGSSVAHLHSLLLRVPWWPLRCWLEARQKTFAATDEQLSACLRQPVRFLLRPFLSCFAVWLAEAFDSSVLLFLLHAPISPATILVVEAVASVGRITNVIVPGALGVTDAGYLWLLQGDGMANAAAFVLLKRLREGGCILAGYGILASLGLRYLPGVPYAFRRSPRSLSGGALIEE